MRFHFSYESLNSLSLFSIKTVKYIYFTYSGTSVVKIELENAGTYTLAHDFFSLLCECTSGSNMFKYTLY